MDTLGPIEVRRRTGKEPFHASGKPLSTSLLDFWQWAFSDVVSNATRGLLAEFLVAQSLGITKVREAWAAYDLETDSGLKVEVKSAAYIQAWRQRNYSTISFGVSRRRYWNKETNLQSKDSGRHADVYVFALLAHRNQATLDPLDVSQWEFYVLPTFELDNRKRSQHSITLPSLRKLAGEPVSFSGLRKAVEVCGRRHWEATGKFPQSANR